jgi:acyl-coenzyme A synthetase/AMP-(fatty) acid ligase
MKTTTVNDLDELEKADESAVMASFLAGAPLDPEVARRVHERAQRIREAIRERHGIVDIAVPAIRELRGELPSA